MSRTSKPRVAASDGMAISRASGRTRRRDFMGTPGIAVQHGFFLPHREGICLSASHSRGRACPREGGGRDRKSVVSGKSVSVSVDLGGRRIIRKKTKDHTHTYVATSK